ncbi:ankyrin repeat domain-containing protein [Legionella sp.]|uniref:ankyrin repeat domain-containing protein n=1 Tax=Legionella sp. TaxID=459 RepID=UPI003C8CBF8D
MNSPVMKLMKQIGLEIEEGGVCFGLAMMAIQAYLQGTKEYKRYSERFDKIIKKGPRCEGDDRQDWIDIQAFLQGVALYQSPDRYLALFPSDKQLTQFNVEEIASVAQSKLIQGRGGIRKVCSFSGLYNNDEIVTYLQSYQQAITEAQIDEKSRCALLLHCYNHAIMLAYDINSGWCLQNHDVRYGHKEADLTLLIQELKKSFPNGPLILSTTVFSLGGAVSKANEVWGVWRANASWKQIHDVTAEKAKINGPGGSWLYIAAMNGHLEVVKILLKQGADVHAVTKKGFTPLYSAAHQGHLKVVKTLLEQGANVNAMSNEDVTPLCIAARNGHLEVVKILLEQGADVNVVTKKGFTPLHFAAENGHLKVVKELLEQGADVNAVTKKGFTPLHFAAENDHLEVVKELLEQGADVNAASNEDVTPLFIAAQNGYLEVVEILLEKGADVFRAIKGNIGELHQTAITSWREDEFIALKEKLSSKDELPNFSPLDAALFFCHPKIAMALINAGAQINQEHTLLFWEWLCSTPLHSSSQEASESYQQLKKSFEMLIKQYDKNKGVHQIPMKEESASDTSRNNFEVSAKVKISTYMAEELTKTLGKLDAPGFIATLEAFEVTDENIKYSNGVISIWKVNIPVSELQTKLSGLSKEGRSFPIFKKNDHIVINLSRDEIITKRKNKYPPFFIPVIMGEQSLQAISQCYSFSKE